MNHTIRKKLVFHAGGVIVLGMLSGIPLAMSLLGYSNTAPDDWQLSHMEGLINGLLMLAIAASAGLLTLSEGKQKLLYLSLVFTGYSNALYGWVRALSGESGLSFEPPIANQVAGLLGGLPIFTAFIAIALLMLGAASREPH